MQLTRFAAAVFISIISQAFGDVQDVSDEEYAAQPPVFQMDDYDTCMLLRNRLFCYVHYEVQPMDKQKPTAVWNTIEKVSSRRTHYRHDLFRLFVCVPSSCPELKTLNDTHPDFKEELRSCLNKKYEHFGLKGDIKKVVCKTSDYAYKTDYVDYVVMTIFIAYMSYVLVASLIDLYKRYDTAENYKKFLFSPSGKMITSFSIPYNWSKLRSENKSPEAEKLRSVQGIRVYMTFLVILVHTVLSVTAIPVGNTKFLEMINDGGSFVGDFSKRGVFILSFHFMMSTWVLIISMFSKADRNEPLNFEFIAKSIIKRYVRFIPTVLVIIGFFATWFRHLPYGPLWDGVCEESRRCRQNWWTNVLFVQNFVNRYFMCHIVSWYLAVEMQYYIICLILVALLNRFGRSKTPHVICTLLALNTFGVFYDHYRHGYSSELAANPEDVYSLQFNKEPQWHDHFASYHANFSGSLLGLLFGYVFYKHGNQNIFSNKMLELMWWVLSVGTLIMVVILPRMIDVDQSPITSALWVAMTRPLFAFGIGLLILGMSQGLGGVIKWIFEWGPLYYLAKLSFTVYIGHTVFQGIRIGFLRYPVHIDEVSMVFTVLADIAMAFIVALFLTLCFEMPSNELANMIFRPKKMEEDKKKK